MVVGSVAGAGESSFETQVVNINAMLETLVHRDINMIEARIVLGLVTV